jgi:hypothetical protein
MHIGGAGIVQEACERAVEVIAVDHRTHASWRVRHMRERRAAGVEADRGCRPVGSAWMATGMWSSYGSGHMKNADAPTSVRGELDMLAAWWPDSTADTWMAR